MLSLPPNANIADFFSKLFQNTPFIIIYVVLVLAWASYATYTDRKMYVKKSVLFYVLIWHLMSGAFAGVLIVPPLFVDSYFTDIFPKMFYARGALTGIFWTVTISSTLGLLGYLIHQKMITNLAWTFLLAVGIFIGSAIFVTNIIFYLTLMVKS